MKDIKKLKNMSDHNFNIFWNIDDNSRLLIADW